MKTLKYEEVYRNEYRDFQTRAPASVNSWSLSIIKNGFIRLSDTFRLPSLERCDVMIWTPDAQPKTGAPPCHPGI